MHQVLPARPDLSVVVVTHDGRELALTTLQSAARAVGELTVEWHVVDSGSMTEHARPSRETGRAWR